MLKQGITFKGSPSAIHTGTGTLTLESGAILTTDHQTLEIVTDDLGPSTTPSPQPLALLSADECTLTLALAHQQRQS